MIDDPAKAAALYVMINTTYMVDEHGFFANLISYTGDADQKIIKYEKACSASAEAETKARAEAEAKTQAQEVAEAKTKAEARASTAPKPKPGAGSSPAVPGPAAAVLSDRVCASL